MPLSFSTLNRGEVAFGFFNIDSDMLLLENYFFFAQDFCQNISKIAESDANAALETTWKIYYIERPERVGDLMGAIRGTRFIGFIGDTYRRYPFPEREADFKQKPEGFENRSVFRDMIVKYAEEIKIPFIAEPGNMKISVGDYRFSRAGFHALLQYVWAGGFPRWRDEERPGYVREMKEKIEQSEHWLFKELGLL